MPSERCWFYRWCTRGKFHWGQGKAWGRKLETEARQQYRTKFVNSVYEIHIIAMTDDGWCMLVSVQWLPPPPATMPLIYKPKYVPFCHLKVKWTKVFEAGSGNYNHWLCNLAAFCATRHCRPPSLSRAKWSQSFMAHSTSVSTERQVDGFLVIAVSQRQALLQFCAHLFFHLYKSKLPPPMMPLILQTEIYAILSSWTKVFEAGPGNYNHWLCSLAAFWRLNALDLYLCREQNEASLSSFTLPLCPQWASK